MITLTYQNVAELVFYDKKIQQILPELSEVFQKWTLGMRTGLDSVAKDALLDFLSNITDDYINRLEEYWKSPVKVQKLNPCIVRNAESPLGDLGKYLNNMNDEWNISLAREGDLIYILLWR